MQVNTRTFVSVLLLGAITALVGCSTSTTEDWNPLLDEDLSRWEIYLSYKLEPGYDGEAPRHADGELIPPIGYNNNVNDVFSVIEENGEPIMKVTGEYYGAVFTKEEFSNYHLTLKVKWGEKKWDPRRDLLKDSGLLYHSIGESGIDHWRSWKLSQEFQIMEGHMGDYWSIANSAIDVRAFIPESYIPAVASVDQSFLSVGSGTGRTGFVMRDADHESPAGSWTELELICFEGNSLHIVNGQVVMALRNSRYATEDGTVPLTKGSIQLQSEAAEVYFKDMRIRNLETMPAKYAPLFE